MNCISVDRLNEYHNLAVKPVMDKFLPDDSRLVSVDMVTGEVVYQTKEQDGSTTTTMKHITFM
jgi:hypothetical protein